MTGDGPTLMGWCNPVVAPALACLHLHSSGESLRCLLVRRKLQLAAGGSTTTNTRIKDQEKDRVGQDWGFRILDLVLGSKQGPAREKLAIK